MLQERILQLEPPKAIEEGILQGGPIILQELPREGEGVSRGTVVRRNYDPANA